MNVVVLHGTLSSTPVLRTLVSGSVLASLEVTTVVDGATASVPVAWFDPPATLGFDLGDAVVITGIVRRRFFRSGGSTQSRTEVVATQVIAAAKRRQVRAAMARSAAALHPDVA